MATQYYYTKGIVHNSVNSVKETTFKVCVAIKKENDYLAIYKKDIIDDQEDLSRILSEDNFTGGRYRRGLVLLAAYLNQNQHKEDYGNFLGTSKVQIGLTP